MGNCPVADAVGSSGFDRPFCCLHSAESRGLDLGLRHICRCHPRQSVLQKVRTGTQRRHRTGTVEVNQIAASRKREFRTGSVSTIEQYNNCMKAVSKIKGFDRFTLLLAIPSFFQLQAQRPESRDTLFA